MEPSQVRLLLREAISAAKTGNKNWARECLSRILRAEPHHEDAWLWMSAVLDTPEEKRYCLERVLAINPQNASAQAGLRHLEQRARVITPLAKVKRTRCPMCGEPNDPQAFQCSNCGQDLFVLCPSCGERVDIDHVTCAACQLEIGDSTQGAAYFFHLGELYLQHGQPKRALEAWDKTLLLNPDYPRIAEAAAAAFLASGQRDLAIQSLGRAIEETEDEEHRRELRLRMANYHRDIGRLEEAEKLYQELLKEDQDRREPHADLLVEMGRFYQQQKDLDQARTYYEMALTLDENLYEVHYTLAEILLQRGYESRALSEFRWLKSLGGELGERAAAQINELRPPLPEEFRNRWQETVRGMARYFLAALLLLLLAAGRQVEQITVWRMVGMLTALIGGYLVTAATATPRNLPTKAHFARLFEGRLGMRMHLRPKKGPARRRPAWLQRLIAWQTRSAQVVSANARVLRMRFAQGLRKAAIRAEQTWQKVKRSRVVQRLKSVPQSRFYRSLAALGKKPPFPAIGRFFRRIVPRRVGPSFLARLGQAIRGSTQHMVGQAGRVSISEMQVYRWIAAILGLFLLFLAARWILSF